LRRIEIGAGGIMTTGMNQHHVAFGRTVEALEHRLEAQLVRGRIVVGIALEP
jgi:hypothetical protein